MSPRSSGARGPHLAWHPPLSSGPCGPVSGSPGGGPWPGHASERLAALCGPLGPLGSPMEFAAQAAEGLAGAHPLAPSWGGGFPSASPAGSAGGLGQGPGTFGPDRCAVA
ncbi:MAG: hypothetical protein ACK55I_38435, partial [bacterium]